MLNRRIPAGAAPLFALVLFVAAATAPRPAGAEPPGTATVIYVSGNDVVVKRAIDGQFLNFTVPPTYKFSADGKKLSLADLHPGTKLSEAIATGDGRVVSEISAVKGKVVQVSPPDRVTLSLTEGFKELMVPLGTTFAAGRKLAELHPGDMIDVTMVTTLGGSDATGNVPPETVPPMTGPVLIAAADPGAALPIAGTHLPLFGILGLILLAAGLYVRSRPFAANPRIA